MNPRQKLHIATMSPRLWQYIMKNESEAMAPLYHNECDTMAPHCHNESEAMAPKNKTKEI